MPGPRLTIVCLGVSDDALLALLRDVLGDLGYEVAFARAAQGRADLVLAAVQRTDAASVLVAARHLAGTAPILALLPFTDERLARIALDAGARACFALDTPLGGLAAAVTALLPAPSRREEVARG